MEAEIEMLADPERHEKVDAKTAALQNRLQKHRKEIIETNKVIENMRIETKLCEEEIERLEAEKDLTYVNEAQ